ncbi:class I SAM-dependent methyltransferase [Candidatus Pelagibacter sp.]|jgi:predicted O-methyltransferase YrrM|nr:class I SAM-dependent methyltransferase [Candidatus Pelagibacter sp.]
MRFETSPFLYKLNYLIKHKACVSIILSFLRFKITKPFFNTFRSKEKKKYKVTIKDKLLTNDFFSINVFDWKRNLKEYKKKDISYLEIGSFEGISAYFVYTFFKNKNIHCVDTWEGSNEHANGTNFKDVEFKFDNNLGNLKNLYKYKNTSDNFFDNNQNLFDIIYIDGLHKYYQVKKDLNNALKYLKEGGIIICDDYFWNLDEHKLEIPISAINEVVNENKLKIVAVTANQIFLKKD